MTTRTRILLAALTAAVLPLVVLAVGTRAAIRDRFVQQYEGSVAAAAEAVRDRIERSATMQDTRLRAVAEALQRDPRQSAALMGAAERAELIDAAPRIMESAGFDFLLLLAEDGTVLSSGHYRNDYGRRADALLALGRSDSMAIVRARRPADTFVVLARAYPFTARDRYTLVGGTVIDSAFLRALQPRTDAPLELALRLPGSAPAAPGGSSPQQRLTMPFIDLDANRADPEGAAWVLSHSSEPLRALLATVDRWFLAAAGAALLLAFLIARALAARVNRPLEDLARSASRVGLDRYDVHFSTRRRDEVGSLARVLDSMVQRLREGAVRLREAERRATVGDMARQVNHDIRNGLLPVRNVIRHLGEVAEQSPAELAHVFAERQRTLQSGIGYLESLAANYARLSPRLERRSCSVNEIVAAATRDAAGDDRVRAELAGGDPHVEADPVALRRIVENLVVNALESLPPDTGHVVARTARRNGTVVIEIEDSGAGMTADVVDRIFDDFYTTKERGTGLGLSIVRRLTADMGGRVSVRSEPGRGSTFTLELPDGTL